MHDVIVIGVGTMGAAVCDVLGRRGVGVLGIDRFSPPHGWGSHHGDTRMFRMAYYEHPDYVPLLKRSRELWLEMNRSEVGGEVYHEVGGLYMGRGGGELVVGSERAAREHGLPHEVLEREELARRFPWFVVARGFEGVYEPRAGFVMSELAVGRMIESAERSGARIVRDEVVRGWEASADSVRVKTDSAVYEAKKLVITSGAWSSRVVGDLGIELVVTRQVLGWVRAPEGFGVREGFPCWAIDNGDGSLHYGFPRLHDEDGLKMAKHFRGHGADPDVLDRVVTAADEAEFRSVLGEHLPGAMGPTVRAEVCMYTNSPDSHFILDRHPEHANVVIACGFSGHGFKFAPVIGEVLADLAMTGKSELPIGFLSLQRFGK